MSVEGESKKPCPECEAVSEHESYCSIAQMQDTTEGWEHKKEKWEEYGEVARSQSPEGDFEAISGPGIDHKLKESGIAEAIFSTEYIQEEFGVEPQDIENHVFSVNQYQSSIEKDSDNIGISIKGEKIDNFGLQLNTDKDWDVYVPTEETVLTEKQIETIRDIFYEES